LRRTSLVVFCAIDAFIPSHGKVPPGFEEFSVALDHAGIPVVWVTNRSRAQMDEPRRKLGHNHPFVAEGGSGVYLPEDYFHLRPAKTVRLGRFTCIPVAETQPAAAEALESLSEETRISVVGLRSLSPREFMQNSGLTPREAELARQRDFDELFFFAGASEQDVGRFLTHAQRRRLQLRERGVLWSLAVGASLSLCVRELSKLYDRALRAHATTLGLAASADSDDLFAACDRGILLKDELREASPPGRPQSSKIREMPLSAPHTWDRIRAIITSKT
jgi:predicted mannosyl-3-phosphoglycerate phosphatase (HAD superfamily)